MVSHLYGKRGNRIDGGLGRGTCRTIPFPSLPPHYYKRAFAPGTNAMPNISQEPHFYKQFDVVHSSTISPSPQQESLSELCVLMREMIAAQDRQNELMETLISQISHAHQRKVLELAMWKKSNPQLSKFCRNAASKLERIQTDLVASIAEEVVYNSDSLLESEFGLSEFVDRFGTKFLHLSTLLQVLSQLGNAPDIQLQPAEKV